MAERTRRSRRDGDAAELCIVEFQGSLGLLHHPVADARPDRDFGQVGLDLAPAQIPPPPSRKAREECRTQATQNGIVISFAPASRSAATYPSGHLGSGLVGAVTRRLSRSIAVLHMKCAMDHSTRVTRSLSIVLLTYSMSFNGIATCYS